MVMEGSHIFSIRGKKVKWPTLRKGYLTDESVARLKALALGEGHSILFLDGDYRTNLNKWVNGDPIERAVFFEWLVRKGTQQFFLLCWVGNFHNGSIFHCGFQFPHILTWQEHAGDEWLERQAFQVYRKVVNEIYGEESIDEEVIRFIK